MLKKNGNAAAEPPENYQVKGWKRVYVEDLGIELMDLDLWEEADEGLVAVSEEVKAIAEGESAEIWQEERERYYAKMHLYGLLRIAKAIERLNQHPKP